MVGHNICKLNFALKANRHNMRHPVNPKQPQHPFRGRKLNIGIYGWYTYSYTCIYSSFISPYIRIYIYVYHKIPKANVRRMLYYIIL